jgi:hypothetical protein
MALNQLFQGIGAAPRLNSSGNDQSSPLLDTLAAMDLRGLQDFAQAHKNDAAMVALVSSVANIKKKAIASEQAQPVDPNQPKIGEQVIAGIAPQPAPQPVPQQMLPEDQGIAQLPTDNLKGMAGGGIVAFEEGGEVPSFSKGGINDEIFNNAFLRTLRYEGGRTNDTGGDTKYGISKKGNPDVDIDALTVEGARKLYKERYWNAISGDKLAAVNPALAQVAFDTAVNQGVGKAKQYVTESGGDPSKMIQLRGEHYEGLVEKNPKKYGAYAKGWANRLGNLATDLALPSAVAAEVTGQAAPQAAPTGGEQPLVDPKRRENYGLREQLLGPYPNLSDITLNDVGRNINNTLNALGGWTAPAATVNRAVGKASGELAPTAEAIAEAARLKQIATTPRLLPPAKAGIAGLDEAAQATREAAENARRSRILAGDVEIAKGAENAVKAAELTQKTARATEEALAAQQNARAIQSAQVANVGKANAALGGVEDLMNRPSAPAAAEAKKPPAAVLPLPPDGLGDGSDKLPPAAAAAAKGGIGDLFNDPMAIMGLQLMASQNPRFLGGVGEAGLATAKYLSEKRKEESDSAYKAALAKNYGVDPMLQRLNALQDPKTAAAFAKMKEMEREPVTKAALFKEFLASPAGVAVSMKPEEIGPAFANYVKSYESVMGPLGGLPAGTKVTRTGP